MFSMKILQPPLREEMCVVSSQALKQSQQRPLLQMPHLLPQQTHPIAPQQRGFLQILSNTKALAEERSGGTDHPVRTQRVASDRSWIRSTDSYAYGD